MHKLIFLVFIIPFTAFGQNPDFKEVDSVTYALFQQENWKELKRYTKTLEDDEFNTYYFNVRLGIAYFNLKEYHSAEKYLLRAISNNSIDYPRQYLYWTYMMLGEEVLARTVYNRLTDDGKKAVDYKESAVQNLDIEMGIKAPSDNSIPNGTYGRLSMQHTIGESWLMTHQGILFGQSGDDSRFTMQQYNLFATKNVENSAFHFGGLYNHSYANTPLANMDTATVSGETTLNSFGLYAGYSRRMGRFKFGVNVNYTFQQSNALSTQLELVLPEPPNPPIPTPVETTSSVRTSNYSFVPSVYASYTLPVLRDAITLGGEFYGIISTNTGFSFRPYATLQFSDRVWLKADYLQVGDYPFVDPSSGVLYTNFQTDKFTGTLNYAFSKRFIGRISYSYENAIDAWQNSQYTMNSIYLGFTFKFNRHEND